MVGDGSAGGPRSAARPSRSLAWMLGTLLVAGNLACDMKTESSAAPTFTVRDSGSARIVESHGPRWGSGEDWSLDAQNVVVLGNAEGETIELWQVNGVTRLSDGRFAVLNGGTGQVFYFDAEGRLLRTVGGQGGGPTEFVSAKAFVRVPGDTLGVLDLLGKQVLFGPHGEFIRNLPFDRKPEGDPPMSFFPVAPLSDGSILGTGRRSQELISSGPWFRPAIHLLRKDSTGTTIGNYGRYGELLQERIEEKEPMSVVVPPFYRSTFYAAGGDTPRVLVGDNDRFELRVFDLDGSLRQVIRLRRNAPPVTPAQIDDWKKERRADPAIASRLPQFERAWAEMTVPETHPAFGPPLGISTDGHFWVAENPTPGASPRRLHMFDPQGVYLGDLPVPVGLSLAEIGPDYFLGVFEDELDVETVRVYRLTRPASSR